MSKSRGNVVEPWDVISAHGADAFRWYYFTAPAALGRLPLLGRDGRRVGAPVPAHALEHLLVLGPLRERRGARPGGLRPGRPLSPAQPRRSPTSTAGRSRGCSRRSRSCASGWTTSTAPPPAGRSPPTSRSSRTGTCASRAAASGRATAPPSRPSATACWRWRRCWRRSPRSSPTRSTPTSPAAPRTSSAMPPDSVHLRDFPEPRAARSSTPSWRRRWRRSGRTVELGRAARAQAKVKVRQPLRRAVIVANDAEREAIDARAGSGHGAS